MSNDIEQARQAVITETLNQFADRIKPGTHSQLAQLLTAELKDTPATDLRLMTEARFVSSAYSHFRNEVPQAPTVRLPQRGIEVTAADVVAAAQAGGYDPNSHQARVDAQLVKAAQQRQVGSDGRTAPGLAGDYGRGA